MKAHLTTFLVALILFLFAAQVNRISAQSSEELARIYNYYGHEKDPELKCARAKELLEKFPNIDDYWKKGPRKVLQNCELRKIYTKCQEADKAFFASPSNKTLNEATVACDTWLDKSPKTDVYYTTRLALATGYGTLEGFYKDANRSFGYAEKALKLLATEEPPEGWKPEDWQAFRQENIGKLLQYQRSFKVRQEMPNAEAAIIYLTKAAEAKNGPAFKDINAYALRAEANAILYENLTTEYNNLSASDRITPKGKELSSRIASITHSLAQDYARIVVLVESQRIHFIDKDAKLELERFCQQQEACIEARLKVAKTEFGIK